jgi:hypothetical protein
MSKDAKQDAKSSSSDVFLEPAAQHHYKFKEPWTVLALDNIQGFLIQLACAGGSGAIAKTTVAPLERVKVSHSICGYYTCCRSLHSVFVALGWGWGWGTPIWCGGGWRQESKGVLLLSRWLGKESAMSILAQHNCYQVLEGILSMWCL